MQIDSPDLPVKKLVPLLLLTLGVPVSCATAFAADVVITSVGQSSDGMMLKVLMHKTSIEADYDSALSASTRNFGAQKAIVAVLGGSAKGLGAAGISKDDEKARSRTLLLEARKRGVKVLVMHIGGDRRRGELTDTLIEAVTGFADSLIVVKSGNLDGVFSRTKSSSAKLIEVETAQAAVPVLEATLKEWGVTR